jgi:alpha-mannosidase
VAVTALFRETQEAGAYLDRYAGEGIEFPHVLRLVEFDGQPAEVRLTVPGSVAAARRASLRGDALGDLPVSRVAAPDGMSGPEAWSAVDVELRPYEIATVYLDLILGRKVTRDLDAHRSVWATVHRVEERTADG